MKVNARILAALVATLLNIVPSPTIMIPMPAAFLVPSRSEMMPPGIARATSIRRGAVKSRLVWAWVRSSSSLSIYCIGGTQNMGDEMAKPSRLAIPNMDQGILVLPSGWVTGF
jgi:hypothetical protein